MNDQRFFDLATQEQRENKFDERLWLKAMAVSDNDRNRAHAAYVVLRVEQIKELHAQQLKVAYAAHKMFCTCPSCACAGPFRVHWLKKLALLASLVPFYGFYYMRADMLPVLMDMVQRRVFDDTLPTQLLWSLVCAGPFFIVLIVSRGAAKCPSCGYSFWFSKKGVEGDALLKAL